MELCKSRSRWFLVPLVLVLGWAGQARAAAPETDPVLRLQERFVTVLGDEEGIEALAAWRGGQGETRVLASAKESNKVHVLDGDSGKTLSQLGGAGSGAGQFGRPYGIAVSGNLVAVVERENRRVQVLQLPTGKPVGTFGEDVFLEPYGVTSVSGPQGLSLFVTDNHKPPDGSEATARVHQFSLTAVPYAVRWIRTFGATSGAGRLEDIEAVQVDYAHQRLLIADEEQRHVKVFTLAGRFTGQAMGGESFRHEPEGIALYPCGGAGYWVVADQSDEGTVYRVFDRATLKEAGVFTGQKTRESDGIAILGADPGGASSGTFFAVYNGRAVAAIAWEDIAQGLGLRCGQ